MTSRLPLRRSRKILPFALAASLLSCGDDKPPVTPDPDGTSRIKGQVEASPGTINATFQPLHLGNAVISVLSFTGPGDPDTVSIGRTLSNPQAVYEVETSSDEANLIVLARGGNLEFQGVVAAAAIYDSTVTAPPLTEETTLEALVYRELRARGPVIPGVFADYQTYLTSYVSGPADRSPEAVEVLATALTHESVTQQIAVNYLSIPTAWNFITAGRLERAARSNDRGLQNVLRLGTGRLHRSRFGPR
jgi:hypothetical protein